MDRVDAVDIVDTVDTVDAVDTVWSSSDSQPHDQMLDQLGREVPPDHRGEIVWLKHTDRVLSFRTLTR